MEVEYHDQAEVHSSLQAIRAVPKYRLLLECITMCPAAFFELVLVFIRPSRRQIRELKLLSISPVKHLRQLLTMQNTGASMGEGSTSWPGEQKICLRVVALCFQMQGEQKSGD